ncbi:MAG: hypothetical protein ACP5HM_00850 [Anaerolineae bacterium]
MGKKKSVPRLSEAQLYRPEAGGTETEASTTEDLTEEYRYVIADLKRIALLALVMLALLIALSFVLV